MQSLHVLHVPLRSAVAENASTCVKCDFVVVVDSTARCTLLHARFFGDTVRDKGTANMSVA